MAFQELTSSHGDVQMSTVSSLLEAPIQAVCRQTSVPPPTSHCCSSCLPHKAFWGLHTLPGSSLDEVFSRWHTMGFGNCPFAPPLVKVQVLTLKTWFLQSPVFRAAPVKRTVLHLASEVRSLCLPRMLFTKFFFSNSSR